MPKPTSEHTSADEKHPFERFQETVKNLIKVPKEEVNEALRSHEAPRKQAKREDTN